MAHRFATLVFGLCCAMPACKGSGDSLHVFFQDELVEAPARTVDVVAVAGTDCKTILDRRHDQASMTAGGSVIARRSAHYPVNPDAKVLDNLPRGTPFALDVATYDRDQNQMGRGCDVVTLPAGGTTMVDLEMHALPVCPKEEPPLTLDVAVVLDQSNQTAAADPSNVHLTEFDQHVMAAASRFGQPATWTLITDDDPDGPKEILPQTSDMEMVKSALMSLITMHQGNPRVYDGVSMAAKKLRARAVCGVRPMIIVFLGDGETNAAVGAREEAVVGIVATRGDSTDDVYTFGMAFSDGAYDELNDLIPVDVGKATGAQGDFQIRNGMNDIGTALKALIQ